MTVNFVTDCGSASVTVFKDGSVSVSGEFSRSPDVTIHASFEVLKKLYSSRSREEYLKAEREGKIRIVTHSLRGRKVERKFRELLGGS